MSEPINDYDAETEALVMKIRQVFADAWPAMSDELPREKKSHSLTALIRATVIEAFAHMGPRTEAFTYVVSQEMNRQLRAIQLARQTRPPVN